MFRGWGWRSKAAAVSAPLLPGNATGELWWWWCEVTGQEPLASPHPGTEHMEMAIPQGLRVHYGWGHGKGSLTSLILAGLFIHFVLSPANYVASSDWKLFS